MSLLVLLSAPTTTLRGISDGALYQAASSRLVGALPMDSFSSARFSNGSIVGHGLPSPEALCHCSCFAEENFAYCHNTAKTTIGVSTFYFDPFSWRWESRALRFFAAGSPGWESGREATNFLARAVLPDGPGGPMIFDSTYTSDIDAAARSGQAARGAEVVRATTEAVDCSVHALCDVQCDGAAQYAAWRSRCDAGTAALDAWSDPPRSDAPSSGLGSGGALGWFVAGCACTVLAGTVWRRRSNDGRDASALRELPSNL